MTNLLSNDPLEQSCIVANNRMNRERLALGSNGYESEIGFDPIEFLADVHERNGVVAWLDLCCGRGKALIETGEDFLNSCRTNNLFFQGVDPVGMFDPVPDELDFVELEEASLHTWQSSLKFDLITCVHGLHYTGDKLGLISRASGWLRAVDESVFVASLDLANLCTDKEAAQSDFSTLFAQHGYHYEKDSNLLTCRGQAHEIPVLFGMSYIGADEKAGPNYSGQDAVDSYYRLSLDRMR